MQTSLTVIEPAEDISLITKRDALLALNLTTPSANTSDQVELMVKWSSAEIASRCRRVFAKEKVAETFLELGSDLSRIYLSRYPVTNIESITCDGTVMDLTGFDLDSNSGTLTLLGTSPWVLPIVVVYTGGYKLPYQAPPELSQACTLLTREAYNAAQRGDATVRMVAHKESRIIYFDPNAKAGIATGGSGGTPAQRAVNDMLLPFIRVQV